MRATSAKISSSSSTKSGRTRTPRSRRSPSRPRPPLHRRNRMPEPTPLPETPKLRSILEALIFAAEEPLTLDDLEELFPGAPKEELQQALDDVASRWETEDRGLQVLRVAGGYRLTTRPDLGE